jgi:hypothetical protein
VHARAGHAMVRFGWLTTLSEGRRRIASVDGCCLVCVGVVRTTQMQDSLDEGIAQPLVRSGSPSREVVKRPQTYKA